MAFDYVRGRLILFGGSDEDLTLHRDTWEWDGEDWTQLSDEGPSPARWLAMTSDSQRKQIVLHGGETFNNVELDETWEWDGEHWTRQEAVGPGKRSKHAMVYDPVRRRVVLAGPDDQTWEWDGKLWRQVTQIGPGVNESHAMAYDGRGVILFGGDNLQQTGVFKQSGSTWEWDGKHWIQRLPIGPEPRTDCAIAYDSKRDRTVLLVDSTDPPKDPWSHSAILGSWPKNCRLFLLTRQAATKREIIQCDCPPFAKTVLHPARCAVSGPSHFVS